MLVSKKQLEVNKQLLAAPGSAHHEHGNKTAPDENTATAEQSDEIRGQHRMLVPGGFCGLFPSPRMCQAAWSPSPPTRPQMCGFVPEGLWGLLETLGR